MGRRMIAAGVLLACISLCGCTKSESAAQDRTEPGKKKRDRFAEDQAPVEVKSVPFDGKRAIKHLEDLCKIGPRISGSAGMKRQQELLKEHFEKLGATVTIQRFEARQFSQRQPVPMANMVISWHSDRERRVLFCGHYDTRPIADQEPDRRKWTQPFVSANDGTSTVAWLMELGRHMKELPVNVGVDFVIFDGEEFIFEPNRDKYFFGSEHFAEHYRKDGRKKRIYLAGILLDLFAAKDAKYLIEENSAFWAGAVVESIWKTAAELNVPLFRMKRGESINDDHIALNKAGIPTIDIIDMGYVHWHRLSDTPEQCSDIVMEQVAKVLLTWLQRVK